MAISVNVKVEAPDPISKEEMLEIADDLMDNCEQECANRGFSVPLCRTCRAAGLILNVQKEIEILRRLQKLEVKQ